MIPAGDPQRLHQTSPAISPYTMNIFKRSKDRDSSKSTNERSLEDENVEEQKDAKSSMTDKLSTYGKTYFKQAQSWTDKEASDAKKALQKAAGLGEKPSVIPEGEALVSGEPRIVEIGWVSAVRLEVEGECER